MAIIYWDEIYELWFMKPITESKTESWDNVNKAGQ